MAPKLRNQWLSFSGMVALKVRTGGSEWAGIIKFKEPEEMPETNRRLDFLCTNSSGVIHVIELKRPNIKLTVKEIQQIAEYVEFIETQFPQTVGHVKGFLISDNMSYEPGTQKVRAGLESQDIFIKSYSDLLAQARQYHQDMISTYEHFRS